ncbi:MAG TPA: ATP-dependent Clp protease proteolytic subunit [Roseomonas sp.]
MEFSALDISDNGVVLGATGAIRAGDDQRLHELVGRLPAGSRLTGLFLNSQGGSVVEAARIAQTVRNSNLPTAVGDIGVCASACFLIFAAGPQRMVVDGARIGVHSASELGADSMAAQAVTTAMAREASAYGVPATIIGRMVTARPSEMAWLTNDELRQMNVRIVAHGRNVPAYAPGSALTPGGTPRPAAPVAGPGMPAIPPAQAATARPPVDLGRLATEGAPSAPPSPTYEAGRRDRGQWETWFGALSGDYREGAFWWSGVRSHAQRDRITCGSDPKATPGFLQGCNAAAQMLAPMDRRRTSEPEYRQGWNSY